LEQRRRFRNWRHNHQADPDGVARWRRVYVLTTILTGSHWGLLAILLFPRDLLVQQVFMAFVLSGISAASVPIYSVGRVSFLAFAAPALLPLAGRFFYHQGEPQMALGAMVLLFFCALWLASRETGRIVRTNMALSHALHHQATHDSLVGLVNHGEFQKRLAHVAEVSRANVQPFALIFIDLDLFKRVNDAGGHALGDEMLRRIGGVLRNTVRKADTAARVGGDEFAIILESCGHREAMRVGREVLDGISQLSVEDGDRDYRIGASIGIAYSRDGSNSARQLLHAADRACYAAKEAGRNRIEVAAATAELHTTGRFDLVKAGAVTAN
jgi:diguanylate cyclase (GGDEF)-like protein